MSNFPLSYLNYSNDNRNRGAKKKQELPPKVRTNGIILPGETKRTVCTEQQYRLNLCLQLKGTKPNPPGTRTYFRRHWKMPKMEEEVVPDIYIKFKEPWDKQEHTKNIIEAIRQGFTAEDYWKTPTGKMIQTERERRTIEYSLRTWKDRQKQSRPDALESTFNQYNKTFTNLANR